MVDLDAIKRNPFANLAMGDLEKEALVDHRGQVVARQIESEEDSRDSYVRFYTGMWSGGFESLCAALMAIPKLTAEIEELRMKIKEGQPNG